MIKRRLPPTLYLIAVLQVVAPLTLPPQLLADIALPLWIIIAAVFALIGVNLLRLRDWARVATVFVQGFNIIVRLLTLVSGAVAPGTENGLNVALLVTAILSMMVSGLIMYYVDHPDIQLIMQR